MSILLDTHIWIRWIENKTDPLPARIVDLIETSEEISVSILSCWELAWLVKRSRLKLQIPVNIWIDAALSGSNVECRQLTHDVILKSVELPEIHRDPIDRFIIAESIVTNSQLISLDRKFSEYEELKDLLITGD